MKTFSLLSIVICLCCLLNCTYNCKNGQEQVCAGNFEYRIDSIIGNNGELQDICDFLIKTPTFRKNTKRQFNGRYSCWKTSADNRLRIMSIIKQDIGEQNADYTIIHYDDGTINYIDPLLMADTYGVIDTIFQIQTLSKTYYFPVTKYYAAHQGEYYNDDIFSISVDEESGKIAKKYAFKTRYKSYNKISIKRDNKGAALPINLEHFEVVKFDVKSNSPRVVFAVISEETGWPTGQCLVYEWKGNHFEYIGKELYINNFFNVTEFKGNDFQQKSDFGFLYKVFTPFSVDISLPNNTFFNDCADMYNAYLVRNALYTNIDWWVRCEKSEGLLGALKTIDANHIKNNDIRKYANETLSAFKSYFEKRDPESNEDDKVLERMMDMYYQYDSLLCNRYNTYAYVNLNEDEYWKALDVSAVIANSDELRGLECTDNNRQKIYHLFKNETDFERKCAYAQLYAQFVNLYRINISDYEELLNAGIYSHRLFFLWRIWRSATQLTVDDYGPSTWSCIPNEMYNEKRRQIAITTLKYLKKHPDDRIAINQYIVLCGQSNIYRNGEYPYGNESFTEAFYLGIGGLIKHEETGDIE